MRGRVPGAVGGSEDDGEDVDSDMKMSLSSKLDQAVFQS